MEYTFSLIKHSIKFLLNYGEVYFIQTLRESYKLAQIEIFESIYRNNTCRGHSINGIIGTNSQILITLIEKWEQSSRGVIELDVNTYILFYTEHDSEEYIIYTRVWRERT